MKVDPLDLPPGYVPIEFPKMKFHPTQGEKVVNDPKEEKALGKGWFDSQQELDAASGKKAPEAPATTDNDPPVSGDAPPMNPSFPKRDDGGDLDPTIESVNA